MAVNKRRTADSAPVNSRLRAPAAATLSFPPCSRPNDVETPSGRRNKIMLRNVQEEEDQSKQCRQCGVPCQRSVGRFVSRWGAGGRRRAATATAAATNDRARDRATWMGETNDDGGAGAGGAGGDERKEGRRANTTNGETVRRRTVRSDVVVAWWLVAGPCRC